MIKFSTADLKQGYLIQNPGWFDLVIKDYKEKPAKTDGSPNYLFFFEGKEGEMLGVPVTALYSSKMLHNMLPLVKACNGGKEVSEDQEFRGEDLIGCVVSGYVRRGQNQSGASINEVTDFRAKG